MSEKNVCYYNKFGFCKHGKHCFRYHENKNCENVNCEVLECTLRHPKKCLFFSQFHYCKFGVYCRYSHEKSKEIESIEVIEKELNSVKEQIKQKNFEIEMLNEEIKKVEEKTKSEMLIIIENNNKVIENEMKVLKEENKIIRSRFDSMEKVMKALEDEIKNKAKVTVIEAEEETELSDTEQEPSNKCGKCDFQAKSEAGLKTHITMKHKTPLFKAYTKISR